MSQVAQPGGAVDRRTDVVAFPAGLAAQLHVAGVDPDAQPDRRQRRPLQIQRASHRVSRPGECNYEAVALALLHRADPAIAATTSDNNWSNRATATVMSSGWVSHNRVEPSTSANSNVTVPVGSSLNTHVAPVSFAHASQHPVERIAEHQQNY